MRRFAGSCRFGHNKALAMQKERHRAGRKEARLRRAVHGAHGVAQQHRDRMAGGCACPSATADIERPERAYTNFFAKRAAFPRFSKKELSESFHYPNPKQITLDQANNRPFLPRLGWLRYHNSRDVPGNVKNVTVSQSCGKWFVSIETEREVADPAHPSSSVVGVDVGVARFATLSDRTFHAPLNSFRRHETALRKAQQAMSRKTRLSNNWRNAKAKVRRLDSRIGGEISGALMLPAAGAHRSVSGTAQCHI